MEWVLVWADRVDNNELDLCFSFVNSNLSSFFQDPRPGLQLLENHLLIPLYELIA